jgi:hypothetical protein
MCIEADNFIARTSGLNFAHTNAYRNFICGLVTDGVWTKFDALWVLYTQDASTAALNLVSSSFTITVQGAPPFVADAGYTGVDSSNVDYLDTNYNPVTNGSNYIQNSAHLACVILNNVERGAPALGADDGSTKFMHIYPRYTDGNTYSRINSNGDSGVAVADSLGMYVGSRTGASTVTEYKNGSSIATPGTTSTGMPSFNLFITASSNAGLAIGASFQVAMASVGAGLTGTDATNFYNRFNTYKNDIANPPSSGCPHTLLTMGAGCGIWAAKRLEENPILTRRGLLVPRLPRKDFR